MMTKILLIDDEPAIRETVTDILHLKGFNVTCAKNGHEGLSVAEQINPDLIICDVMMPEMNGYEVARRIRSNSLMSAIPFIFLSAKSSATDMRQGLRSGADDYISKPFFVDDLVETIKMRLQRIEDQRAEINKWTDGARRAKMIQDTIFPPEEKFRSIFPNHFSIALPRDHVSGDFYWVYEKGNKKYVAVADCTGHGIQGALLSIVCYEKLNSIMASDLALTPATILNEVNSQLHDFMMSDPSKITLKDGMDISLCMIDYQQNELVFSGACRPMYIISRKRIQNTKELSLKIEKNGNHLYQLKGEIFSISAINKNHEFQNRRLSIEEGDLLYLFSDGYVDQFGGSNNKKFKSANFRKLIFSISGEPMMCQESILQNTFEKWRGSNAQIDDVCVVGIEI